IRFSQTYDSLGIYFPLQGEVWADGQVEHIIKIQYCNTRAFLLQNNFHSQNLVFESFRMKLREDEDFKRHMKYGSIIFFQGYPSNDPKEYDWIVQSDAFLAYRFNQALTLAFLNAYNK
ncbi:hypothetical protein H2277_09120, partial [Campylobacter sp. W0014]|uniref:hypothetical protein n=1 Tax=Campylobacter sp. W0014 TaxID=2735781 RepID=UPI001EC8ED89|nr:hypothetical protein [Campylobacter sp. W0014]